MLCPWLKATASKEKDEAPQPASPSTHAAAAPNWQRGLPHTQPFYLQGKGSVFLEQVQLNA